MIFAPSRLQSLYTLRRRGLSRRRRWQDRLNARAHTHTHAPVHRIHIIDCTSYVYNTVCTGVAWKNRFRKQRLRPTRTYPSVWCTYTRLKRTTKQSYSCVKVKRACLSVTCKSVMEKSDRRWTCAQETMTRRAAVWTISPNFWFEPNTHGKPPYTYYIIRRRLFSLLLLLLLIFFVLIISDVCAQLSFLVAVISRGNTANYVLLLLSSFDSNRII